MIFKSEFLKNFVILDFEILMLELKFQQIII